MLVKFEYISISSPIRAKVRLFSSALNNLNEFSCSRMFSRASFTKKLKRSVSIAMSFRIKYKSEI